MKGVSDAVQLTLFGSDTLAEARAMVEAGRDDGIACPCCGQYAKVYNRKFNANMARFLISLFRRHEELEWVHYRKCNFTGRDYPYVSLWGLAETNCSDETTKRMSGFWRLTPNGRLFVQGRIRVPSHCYLYNNEALHFSDTWTTIREALGKKFNYAELMGWHVE